MDFAQRLLTSGQIFTPGSPVNERDLFSGRIPQLQRITDALSQRGYHAVLFGERGVGKTSLANILVSVLAPSQLIAKVNCDAGDTFTTIWKKALREINYTQVRPSMGFMGEDETLLTRVSDTLPEVLQPDDIRRVLTDLAMQRPTLIVLDEYDRLTNKQATVMISDTIKSLSDFGVGASILLIGVASSIDDLIEGHTSIERALVQIPMPRMSNSEITEIVSKGLRRLEMSIDPFALSHLTSLSQGLPYIAHLLALHSTRASLRSNSLEITREHVDVGIKNSLDQWQQSIKTGYYEAVRSQQPGAIYKEVLLACALAEVDDMGYFTAASVRSPLSSIANRTLDIPNFARHLKEFSQPGRGEIITRVGEARKLRYRFVSPLMRPYIIMRGYDEGLIS